MNPVNDPPTISAIADTSVLLGTSTPAIGFTVGDVETNAALLVVTASSDNALVVPNDALSLAFGGSGSTRTLVVTPSPLAVGTATITLTVSDGTNTAQTSFLVTVTL